MKKKMFNETHIEGRVYEHDLALKVSGDASKKPGTEFISGTLKIATDEECLNVVEVHFTYVTAVTSKGSANATFTVLKNIIDGNVKTVMANGADEAHYVRIDSAIGLNDFYTTDKNSGEETLVSAKRVEGGFIHTMAASELNADEAQRSTFRVDMVITNAARKQADEERNLPEKMILKGAIFDFRKALLPIELSVLNPAAMDYFEGLEISNKNPVFTQLKGKIVSTTVSKTITEESAFGEPSVRTVKSTNKDYVVTWAAADTYEWDSEEFITGQELNEAMQNREVYLADVKRKADEYKANKNNALNKATSAPTTKTYNF